MAFFGEMIKSRGLFFWIPSIFFLQGATWLQTKYWFYCKKTIAENLNRPESRPAAVDFPAAAGRVSGFGSQCPKIQ